MANIYKNINQVVYAWKLNFCSVVSLVNYIV